MRDTRALRGLRPQGARADKPECPSVMISPDLFVCGGSLIYSIQCAWRTGHWILAHPHIWMARACRTRSWAGVHTSEVGGYSQPSFCGSGPWPILGVPSSPLAFWAAYALALRGSGAAQARTARLLVGAQ